MSVSSRGATVGHVHFPGGYLKHDRYVLKGGRMVRKVKKRVALRIGGGGVVTLRIGGGGWCRHVSHKHNRSSGAV